MSKRKNLKVFLQFGNKTIGFWIGLFNSITWAFHLEFKKYFFSWGNQI